MELEYKDFIIPLAWPNSFAKTANGPYDRLLEKFKLVKNGYYKTGHAALLLINSKNGQIKYFDFGRYISPPLHGRIRDEQNDPETAINFKAVFNEQGKINNLNEIIKMIAQHPETHGSGEMYASVHQNINFTKAFNWIKKTQKRGPIPYGPFHFLGSNCSRFVASVLANAGRRKNIFYNLPFYLTPSPLGNLYNSNLNTYFKVQSNELYVSAKPNIINHLKLLWNYLKYKPKDIPPKTSLSNEGTVSPPSCSSETPAPHYQWLGGTGSGAWYFITSTKDDHFLMGRKQGNGSTDFLHKFSTVQKGFNIEEPYQFTYPSHAQEIRIRQKNKSFLFTRLSQ